jgi:hypothetical protein
MATLVVKAKPGAGLQQYTVEIDGKVAVSDPQTSGTVEVDGACGDGSTHRANFTFYGPAGKTFGFTVKCGSKVVLSVVGAKVPAQTAPNAAGGEDFQL